MIQYAFKCNIKHKYIIFKISELNNSIEIQYYDSNINRFSNSHIIGAKLFADFYKILRREKLYDICSYQFSNTYTTKNFYIFLSVIQKYCKKCLVLNNKIFNINKLNNIEIQSFIVRSFNYDLNEILNGIFVDNKLVKTNSDFIKFTNNYVDKINIFCYNDYIINF
jgi:hypothetical protein